MKTEDLLKLINSGVSKDAPVANREVLVRIDDVDEGHTYTRKVAKVYVDRGNLVIEGELGI